MNRSLKADFTPFRSAAFKALSSSRLTRSRGRLISPDLLHETSLAVPGPQDGPDQPRQHEGGSTKDLMVIRCAAAVWLMKRHLLRSEW